MRSTWLAIGALAFTGCGDDNNSTMDAAGKMDAPGKMDAGVDAPAAADYTWDEGGGVLIEYQTIYNAMGNKLQARGTAYFWKSLTPARFEFAPIPGCAKTGIATPNDATDDIFPWGMGTAHTYLNVGTPIVTGGANDWVIPAGTVGAKDGESRLHDGKWNFFVNPDAGPTYLDKADAPYSLILTGSSEWPAQVYKDAFYMPPPYTPTNPAIAPTTLVADTPMVQTWTIPNAPQNLPAGSTINYVTGFIVPGIGPVAVCFTDNPNGGTLTVPADIINYVRSLGTSGVMGRAMFTHRVKELTDGTTHNHKRMDFVTKWCVVSPWTAAP